MAFFIRILMTQEYWYAELNIPEDGLLIGPIRMLTSHLFVLS